MRELCKFTSYSRIYIVSHCSKLYYLSSQMNAQESIYRCNTVGQLLLTSHGAVYKSQKDPVHSHGVQYRLTLTEHTLELCAMVM